MHFIGRLQPVEAFSLPETIGQMPPAVGVLQPDQQIQAAVGLLPEGRVEEIRLGQDFKRRSFQITLEQFRSSSSIQAVGSCRRIAFSSPARDSSFRQPQSCCKQFRL